jgi:uncharacterized membrane protein
MHAYQPVEAAREVPMLREWLIAISEPAISIIDIIATVVILVATLQALINVIRTLLRRSRDQQEYRRIWLTYGRWLVAGLTFQLAADIVESSIVPTWQAIAELGAVAVIRTFLNYFLERDIGEMNERRSAELAPANTRLPP